MTRYFKFYSDGEQLYAKADIPPTETAIEGIKAICQPDEGTFEEITEEEYLEDTDEE